MFKDAEEIRISRLPGYPHSIDATDAAVPLDRRRCIQMELWDAGRERRQALFEFDTRQRFTDATMGAGTEGGHQPWLVGSTDVKHVGTFIDRFVPCGGHG